MVISMRVRPFFIRDISLKERGQQVVVGFKSELEVAKNKMMIFFLLSRLDIKMDTPGQFVYKRGHNAITVNLSDVALIHCCILQTTLLL